MLKSIGMIELNSIARAVETADTMVKAGDVDLIFSKPVCPGKYIIMIAGDVGAVKSSVAAGLEKAGQFAVENFIIPNVNPQVLNAFNGANPVERVNAIGVMEFFNIASSIIAADKAVKSAQVKLLDIRLGISIGGKSYVVLTGDVSAVNEAVEAATVAAKEAGTLINKAVISNPSEDLFVSLL
ncbi:BMC domain-containing protein [Lutispora thermophila]|uniref:Carboxysome shell and ethanolamine utilization microcompartment protein CcmL/EutN n=1 Tax=Lutispora thermophila DSM 19022 TaxID=1122184 RepID=A0A1M6FJ84_9FIRM|nr:BMC domain-containing protein [Lutispora thermophila]SHI97767.1 Carboxysome shell and ethanolamine utilization microcompartment protein CcmL/EutN [Lutispora thermophila DSM 19022]